MTGSLELDAHYSTGILRSINRAYETDSSLKLYFEPDPENVTIYDTLGGGLSFGEANRVSEMGYRGWGANSIEVGSAMTGMS